MSITRNFKLFLNAGRTGPLVIHANQYDSGEQWVFSLFTDAGIPYTPTTGAIVGIKSDNLGIINTGTVVDGKVVINETEQMTAAPGRAVFELLVDDQTHGTANFEVWVEPKPGNNADLSESDLSLIQQAIDSTSPTVIANTVSEWLEENITNPTNPAIDTSLSVAGAAADAKATGDAIAAVSGGGGLTDDVKQALMDFARAVAFAGNDPLGQTYIDALEDALYPPADLSSISAVYTQSGTVYETDSLDSLKSDLVVTAHYDDSSTETVTTYTLSGTLTEGTSTITVSYGGKTTTFNVTVTETLSIVFQSGYTRSNVNGKLEANASRSASSIIPIGNNTVGHTVSCTINGSSANIALRCYDQNGICDISSGFASQQTTPIGINAFSVILQTSLTSETVILTIDGQSYSATIGTVQEYSNTVAVNASIQTINASTGESQESTARVLTDFIDVVPTTAVGSGIVRFSLTAPSGIYIKLFEWAGDTFMSSKTLGGLNSNSLSGNVDSTCTKVKILFKKSNSGDFTSADIESLTLDNYGLVNYEFTEV